MRHLIYFLIAFLLSCSVYAKTLQGDGVNGVAASENFMKQGDAEIVVSGVRKVFTNQENPTSCGTHGNTDKVEFKRTKSKLTGGDYNWEITKHEGDMTGYGIAYDFSITENLNKSRVPMKISFDVMSESGNLTFGKDSEVKIYIIPSNEEYIEIAGGRDILGPRSERTFVPNATIGNAFSLCFLVRTNRVSPFIFSLDNIKVSVAGPASRGDVNNTFTAVVSATGVVSNLTGRSNWINNATVSDVSLFNHSVNGFTSPLNCTMTPLQGSVDPVYIKLAAVTATNVSVRTYKRDGGKFAYTYFISCTRTGSDYVPNAVLADQYTGMDIYFEGRKSSDQVMTANVTKLSLTASKDTTGSWSGDSYKVPSSGNYLITGGFFSTASFSLDTYIDGVPALRRVVSIAGGVYGIGAVVVNLNAGQMVDFRASSSVTIQGSNPNTILTITKLNSSQSIFRPDTFYPADVVTSEVQVGWDRTVTPIKPIYKRCHKVVSDISGTVTMVTWESNLRPINVLRYSNIATTWVLLEKGVTADNYVLVRYDTSNGNVLANTVGSNNIPTGTTICMEYSKP